VSEFLRRKGRPSFWKALLHRIETRRRLTGRKEGRRSRQKILPFIGKPLTNREERNKGEKNSFAGSNCRYTCFHVGVSTLILNGKKELKGGRPCCGGVKVLSLPALKRGEGAEIRETLGFQSIPGAGGGRASFLPSGRVNSLKTKASPVGTFPNENRVDGRFLLRALPGPRFGRRVSLRKYENLLPSPHGKVKNLFAEVGGIFLGISGWVAPKRSTLFEEEIFLDNQERGRNVKGGKPPLRRIILVYSGKKEPNANERRLSKRGENS